jgi:two-component system capsular synthesis sensor histidine kinase RcsC
VEGARQALERIRAEKFDLVLTDIRMPEMNGYEMARAIRQSGSQVPIYALTAHVMDYVPMKCSDAGMNGFIRKPINIEEFKTTVKQYLGSY